MTWDLVPLGTLATFTMGQAPAGNAINESGNGTPLYRSGEFENIRPSTNVWTTTPLRTSTSKDVWVCVVGANAGQVNLGADGAIGRSVAAISVGSNLDQRFLYYFLKTQELSMRSGSQGSVQAVITKSDLARMELLCPPLETQRAIAAILGSLDDKIESNRRAFLLAEALADQLLAHRVSGTVTLTDAAHLTMGSSPPSDTYNEEGEGMPFYQGIRDFGPRFPAYRVWTTGAVRLAHENDTLISVRAPVGELNRSRETCCIGRGVAAVRSDHSSTMYYALRAAKELWEPFQHEGTVFGAINKSDLSNARLPWPDTDELGTLECQLSAIDDKIRSLMIEIGGLTTLRDTLLPELLSGRIRVTEVREAVNEVVT